MALNAANRKVTSPQESLEPPASVPAPLNVEQNRPETPVSPPSNDPRVAELKGMFPTLPSTVISDVIQTHSHPSLGLSEDDILDRSIGDLLEMSDPSFKSDRGAATVGAQHVDVSLDEQFARSLALQDQQQQQQRNSSWPVNATGEQLQVPYQPRVRRSAPAARTPSPAEYEARGQSGEMNYNYRGGGVYDREGGQAMGQGGDIQEKVQQYAAVGKKTIDSLFTKAKSKFNELQEAQQARATGPPQGSSTGYGGSSQTQGASQPTFGTGASGIGASLGGLWSNAKLAAQDIAAGMKDQGQGQGQGQATGQGQRIYDQAEGRNRGSRQDGYSNKMGAWGTQQQQQASRKWAPGDEFDDGTGSRSINVYQPSSTSSSDTGSPPMNPTQLPVSSTTKPYEIAGGGASALGRSPTSALSATSPSEKSGTSPSGKIDLSKLGMLPKKKVSLLSSSPSTGNLAGPSGSGAPVSAHTQIPSTSARKPGDAEEVDEDEEFTRNPFDE